MRRRTLATASAAAVAISLGGFASAALADNAMPIGPADTHVSEAPKVTNTFGPGAEVHYDVEPANLILSEFTTGRGIEWESWGPDEAVGTGDLYGVWIGLDGEYYEDVTITLSSVEDGYFTEFTVTGDFEQPEHPEDLTHGYIPGYLG
ncbi:hypothetical protein [Glycomyces harbinensis]|uniref:Uncharacterized protein n=1 Tax=Glycomyces harbinensis TaxID=58114 RepID=A0A1G6VAI6_9ACTN|nr:hypothetical protein [Glycomyces harbinensis]SDD50511.1 hypothetical protein SAMN05216270_104309 [Glycomyces harbinensis]